MKLRLITTLIAVAALSGCATYDYAGGSAPGGYYYGRSAPSYYNDGYGYGYPGYGGYGGYGVCIDSESSGSVYAGLGDPADFAENGQSNPTLNITGMRSNAVPLPGTLALLGLGFAAMGFTRKTLKR